MYNPRGEPREFLGATEPEAISKACDYFRRTETELIVSPLDPEEVSGLASRAIVVAVPRDREVSGIAVEERPRAPRRAEERGRRARPAREREPARERPREEPRREERRREEPRREPPREASVPRKIGELGPEGEFVLGVLERMDLGSFEIGQTEEGDLHVVAVNGPAALHLTESDGRVIEAIQLLANQAAMRSGGEEAQRVVLEFEGDADRRATFLETMASRAAQRALRTRRSIALDPMNPRDRRVVHLTLRDFDGVATISTGEQRYRRVLVVPEGAPEYEEARRAMEAASREQDR